MHTEHTFLTHQTVEALWNATTCYSRWLMRAMEAAMIQIRRRPRRLMATKTIHTTAAL